MAIELAGEHTTARVMVDDESLVEDSALEQIQELVDHPAFTRPVRIMPDTHWGAGAPIGFAMPLGERIVPNVVGVDVGCGMTATNLGEALPLSDDERERRVREAVPMGRSVHGYDEAVHLVDEFPFDRANDRFDRFAARYRERFDESIAPIEFEFDGYDGDYFKSLCDRVLAGKRQGMGHVIKSAGTLGGGNHFLEFARARESGDYWLVVHSGSRYLGLAVAEYWSDRATERRNVDTIRSSIRPGDQRFLKFDPETVSDRDLFAWVTGGMGESHLRKERLRTELEGAAIEAAFDRLGTLAPTAGDDRDRNTELDYLEGREAHGYYVDMLFAQQYARWNRELMSDAVCAALDVDPVDRFSSVHNYVDFEDLVIRKGATPAREGQRLVIPFNMAEGSVLARGRGNDDWHRTAPHGAGRTMGRREAHDALSMDAFADAMDGVYSESIVTDVLDEAPQAYKPAASIRRELTPTAAVIDRLDPVHNLKATD
jgi:RNA-splicing ligase RtcB